MNPNDHFFCNKDCTYFPCHKVADPDKFNCFFCYCPLYEKDCPGPSKVLPNGIKDCSDCLLVHTEEGAAMIIQCLIQEFNCKYYHQPVAMCETKNS